MAYNSDVYALNIILGNRVVQMKLLYVKTKEKLNLKIMKNLLIFIICIVLLSGCMSAKPPCPTYADIEDWPAMTVQYDTIVSVKGDTLLYKKPYKLKFLEKAGFVAISAICIWAIQYNKDERD